jgi:acyl-CoA dehydrogenase
MYFEYTETQDEIRSAVCKLCATFGPEYWAQCDHEGAYPERFVQAMTEAGWLGALIPEAYGGAGLGIMEGCIILEEINRSGGNGAACHAQMYTMASILKNGSEEQKRKYLPSIAGGSLRLQAFGITEPDAGSNTLKIRTFARKVNGGYVIDGQKIWTSRFFQSHMYLIITRTTPVEEVKKKTDGLTLFLVDIAKAGPALRARPIRTMLNHHTNEVFIENLEVSDDDRIGEEGKGFYYLVDSLNSERLLVTSECIGDGRWFIEQASRYGSERVVFDRPIGQNQGWEAADACMTTFGGYGVAAEYHVERKWKEARLFRTAPLSNNLILAQIAQHSLGMPRSY